MRKANPKALNLRARSNRAARTLPPSRNPPRTPPLRTPAARTPAPKTARRQPAKTSPDQTPMPPAEDPPRELWAAQRSAAASEHLARLEARQDAEHRRAEEHLTTFVRAAQVSELAPQPLLMQCYIGWRRTRTTL